jgi:DNA-binding beta-propeller fold protein YncE
MDANGNKLYSTEAITGMVGYRSDYIQVYKDSKYSVIDAQGNPALPGTYDTIYGEDKGRFRIKNSGDTNYSLIAMDGSTVMSGPNMFEGDKLGFVTCGESDNYSVATPGNRVITGLHEDSEELVFTKDDEASYLVLNTGEFASADGADIDSAAMGVIALESEGGSTKLVDAFTGQELMSSDSKIDDINDDYIYCEDGDDLIIYKVVIVPES